MALRGPEKAAALLLYMGKHLASCLLTHFDADELKQVTWSIADLGTVPAPVLESLVEEFASQFADGADLLGTADEVQQMLDGVLPPEQIADVMSDVTGNSNHVIWDSLSQVPEAVLAVPCERAPPNGSVYRFKDQSNLCCEGCRQIATGLAKRSDEAHAVHCAGDRIRNAAHSKPITGRPFV
jgi:flagellar motor switch protein FliG